MFSKLFDQKGQTLIEALIALGIAVTIISAITTIVISSLNNSTFSKNQNLARSYVQETLEKVRGLVQSNYSTFIGTYTSSSPYCVDQNDNLLCTQNQGECISDWNGSCNQVKTGIFIRQVQFETQSGDCQNNLKATVTVSWNDGKCKDRQNLYCHSISSSTCFANINAVPTSL